MVARSEQLNITNESKHWGRRFVAGTVLAGAALLATEMGTANAEPVAVVGGMTDPSGSLYEQTLRDQGQIMPWDQVTRIEYPASIAPVWGDQRMDASVAVAVPQIVDWVNQHGGEQKTVRGFSEGTEPVAQASNLTNQPNTTFILDDGPQGVTGVFNSSVYNNIPLVKPITELVGVPDNTPLNPTPNNTIIKRYNEGDGYSNLAPQNDIPGLIDTAKEMIVDGAHAVQAPGEHTTFVDTDGVVNEVYPDGSPFTVNGAGNPEFDQAAVVHNDAPSFWGEAPCIAPDGSQYWTPGEAPC